jgi:RNA polymerase sigma-70 factor (ECF subfamily)
MHAIDKMGHRDIAAQLGITEGTSKSQLSRARQMLKDLLEKN